MSYNELQKAKKKAEAIEHIIKTQTIQMSVELHKLEALFDGMEYNPTNLVLTGDFNDVWYQLNQSRIKINAALEL